MSIAPSATPMGVAAGACQPQTSTSTTPHGPSNLSAAANWMHKGTAPLTYPPLPSRACTVHPTSSTGSITTPQQYPRPSHSSESSPAATDYGLRQPGPQAQYPLPPSPIRCFDHSASLLPPPRCCRRGQLAAASCRRKVMLPLLLSSSLLFPLLCRCPDRCRQCDSPSVCPVQLAGPPSLGVAAV